MVDSTDFTHSMKRLSNGLGFHHKKPPLKSSIKSSLQTDKNWPDFFYQEKWDFDDPSTYQQILHDLQSPWLGDSRLGDSELGTSKLEDSKSADTIAHTKSPSLTSGSLNTDDKAMMHALPKLSVALTPSSSPLSFNGKAALVDALLLSLWFFPVLGVFVFLTENNSLRLLSTLWLPIISVFLCFSQIYCFLCRVFCQSTFGEFIFGKRLVLSQKLLSKNHLFYLLCLWRAVLITLTGGVTLPFLSYIFKRDFLKTLTGLDFICCLKSRD